MMTVSSRHQGFVKLNEILFDGSPAADLGFQEFKINYVMPSYQNQTPILYRTHSKKLNWGETALQWFIDHPKR